MIGCVISLLLLNTFYCSLGHPVNQSQTTGESPLVKSIQLLASSCENAFLATQIKTKIDSCNFPETATGTLESKFECFIFYDINSQLCTAYRGSKQDLSQTYATRMNEVQKVQVTCDLAKNWKFTKITEFPMYNMSERLFKTQVTCVKACGVEDILSEDTNFYCKYYQWGTEMLQNLITSSPLTGNMPSEDSGPELPLVVTQSKLVESSSAPTSSKDTNLQNIHEHPEAVQTNLDLSNVQSNTKIKLNKTSSTNAGQPGANVNEEHNAVPPLERTGEVSLNNDINPNDNENDVGEDIDDEPPPESQQISDGVDTRIQPDPQPEVEMNKHNDAAPIMSNIDMSHKVPEFNANTLPDGFAEDDDHFFSFFLTAIILVIFMYVLYHNKSKFRKVILGLLVEGRQSGRRRNSRGHEYRRLDTLEQAMSTNSAAPPSKIIY